jgi:hypothetical protein
MLVAVSAALYAPPNMTLGSSQTRWLISDVNGSILPSLFTGIVKSPAGKVFENSRAERRKGGGCQSEKAKRTSPLARLFGETVVYAQSCEGDSCGSHYMTPESLQCAQGCGGSYIHYYDDGGGECYTCGWIYFGTACSGCQCREMHCSN